VLTKILNNPFKTNDILKRPLALASDCCNIHLQK